MKQAKEAKVMEEHINRLPDEILNVIFDKVSEAKFLLYCSLVSKRFGSLIPDTRFVSVQQLPNPNGSSDFVEKFLSFKHFIKRFRCIDTLYFQRPLSKPANRFVNWEIEFKNCLIPTQFLFLSAQGFHTMKNEEEEDDCSKVRDNNNNHVKPELCLMEKDSFKMLTRFICIITSEKWMPWRRPFFKKNVMIQKLVITDSNGEGKIVARRDGVEETNVYQLKWQVWYVPVLQLPNSRGVMKRVMLAVSKAVCGNGDGDGDLVCSANGEKTLLWEAAREIMKQNPIPTQKLDITLRRPKTNPRAG